MAITGYARVSTDGQIIEARKQSLQAAGAERVFAETASGTRVNRKELWRALKTRQPFKGDHDRDVFADVRAAAACPAWPTSAARTCATRP